MFNGFDIFMLKSYLDLYMNRAVQKRVEIKSEHRNGQTNGGMNKLANEHKAS